MSAPVRNAEPVQNMMQNAPMKRMCVLRIQINKGNWTPELQFAGVPTLNTLQFLFERMVDLNKVLTRHRGLRPRQLNVKEQPFMLTPLVQALNAHGYGLASMLVLERPFERMNYLYLTYLDIPRDTWKQIPSPLYDLLDQTYEYGHLFERERDYLFAASHIIEDAPRGRIMPKFKEDQDQKTYIHGMDITDVTDDDA